MGKKRTVKKQGGGFQQELRSRSLSKIVKRKLSEGVLYVEASFNNTSLSLTDTKGNLLSRSSSGALGFKGAKKGTPFAAAKVGELVGEKSLLIGIKEVSVVMSGVGSGRESAIRSFASKGIDINKIVDATPVPFNGPRARKARRT
ncbi:MAG: 30S ribosomal protein S11 [Candidatus Paceibacterota bacterium]